MKAGEKTRPGLNVPKCFGASWRRPNRGGRCGATFSRILACSRALARTRTYIKEIDRDQDAQNTIEAVKVVSGEKKRNQDQCSGQVGQQ